jgi:formylglycine-generating enzyme required for sulfatase activity
MKITGMVIGLLLATASAWAGNLNPSAPPTAGTMKPLTDIEPRTAVQTLAGSATAVYVISQPGSYYLTGKIVVTQAKHGISIEASNVSLDLCGFTLTGAYETVGATDEPPFDGIRIKTGSRDIVIHNGIIEGERKVDARIGNPPKFTYIRPFARGIAADWDLSVTPRFQSSAIQIRDLIVRGSRGYGIYLKGQGHFVTGCTVKNNEGPGIHAGYPSTVSGNHQSDNGDNMLSVQAGSFAYQNAPSIIDWTFLPAYLIAKYETTNTEYSEFLNEVDPQGEYWDSNMEIQHSGVAGGYVYTATSGREGYPIVYVSFSDAAAFVSWESHVTGRSYRLPTEQEWEKAAGWDPVERKHYTYGFHSDAIDDSWCNYNDAYGGPLPIGSFNGTGGKNDAKSFYGCYDMSGNVLEWTSSARNTDPRYRVFRGGGWFNGAGGCTTVVASSDIAPSIRYNIGFRLVQDP